MKMHIFENMEDREVKIKKTRRGKRSGRRSRRGEEGNFTKSDDEMSDLNVSHANKDLNSVKWRKFYVRPRYSPTAPHNSTQFIMDDQHQCLNYKDNFGELSSCDEMSFYSYNHGEAKCSDYEIQSPGYESPVLDLDSVAFRGLEMDSSVFMAKDFESFYNQVRADELSKLSKVELIEEILCMDDKVSNLEGRVSSLHGKGSVLSKMKKSTNLESSDKKIKAKSKNVLSSLQEELEILKKENQSLKEEISSLSS